MANSNKPPRVTNRSRRPARAGRNSRPVEKIQINLRRRLLSPVTMIIGAALVSALILVSVIALIFTKVYASPENVFWDAIDNNLATRGISKQTVRPAQGSSTNEVIQISFNPEVRVHDIKTITDSSSKPPAKLTLESIGTPKDDYERYRYIYRPGKKTDYSRIYNMWLKNGGGATSSAQVLNSTLFGAVLMGDLPSKERAQVLNLLKDAYEVNFTDYQKQSGSSRRTYMYPVTVSLVEYARAANIYATAEGLPFAKNISPNNYRSTDKLKVKISVDVLSRQIRKIEYVSQGVEEYYSGYGITKEINLPDRTVTGSEFQSTLQSVLQ